MDKKPIKWLILGGALRYYLASSEWGTIFQNRVEIATPLNSYKRGKELKSKVYKNFSNKVNVNAVIFIIVQLHDTALRTFWAKLCLSEETCW